MPSPPHASFEDNPSRFQELLESLPVLVWEAWGAPGKAQETRFVSGHVETLTGYTANEWLASPNFWLSLVHPDDREEASRISHEKFQGGGVFKQRYRWIVRDGRTLWIEAHGTTLRDDEGHPVGMRGVCLDISARVQAEKERAAMFEESQQARREAERANRAKDEFLAMLSHELRTPLNAMLGWTRLLRAGELDAATAAHALEVVERNTRSQARLIDDMLDVSRIVTGKFHIEQAPTSIAAAVRAAFDTMRAAAHDKAVTLDLSIAPGEDTLLGDAERLQQVVFNLVSNAIKFTPEGGRVTLKLERGDGIVRLVVSDTGCGIDAAALPTIFERFNQGDGDTSRLFGGMGLGLAIVHYVVTRHGGTVQAQSPGLGQGATFTVELPLLGHTLESQRSNGQPETGAAAAAKAAAKPLGGLRVLLLDDDADALEMLATVLRLEGADVYPCTSSPAALQRLEKSEADLIVSDIGMPELDGYEFIRRVREGDTASRLAPAIALSAYAAAEDATAAREAGFHRHMAKPLDPIKLVELIVSLTGRNTGES